jgi:hypothetical protein
MDNNSAESVDLIGRAWAGDSEALNALLARHRDRLLRMVEMRTVGRLEFESGVPEVFTVALLPRRFPDLIDDEKVLVSSFVVPTESLDEVAATVRASGPA